jgi:hypothetical protein
MGTTNPRQSHGRPALEITANINIFFFLLHFFDKNILEWEICIEETGK